MKNGIKRYKLNFFGWNISIDILYYNQTRSNKCNKRIQKYIRDTGYEYRPKDK